MKQHPTIKNEAELDDLKKQIDGAITCDKGCGHELDPEICYEHQIERVLALFEQYAAQAKKAQLDKLIDEENELYKAFRDDGELHAGIKIMADAVREQYDDEQGAE